MVVAFWLDVDQEWLLIFSEIIFSCLGLWKSWDDLKKKMYFDKKKLLGSIDYQIEAKLVVIKL